MLDIRPVLFINGVLLIVLAAAMGVPALVDFWLDDLDWQVFFASSVVTGFTGAALVLAYKPAGIFDLNIRQAFMLTGSSWLVLVIFAALPFGFSAMELSIADSFFESMSALTTTGSTVISGLDFLPRGLLLWRAILQWLGGIGIIVTAVALLPLLRIGGMQLFRMESSDKTEKVRPRVSQIANAIFLIYVSFTITCALAYWSAGMTLFEAIAHSMTTVATGGFSTSDSSLGYFANPTIEWIAILFMTLGSITFTLFIAPWKHGQWQILRDSQVRWFVRFIFFFSVVLGLWHWTVNDVSLHDAMRGALFNVVSVVTTTGYASTDYQAWGGFAWLVFFILTFIGGCTGSTSGGIKIFRYEVLFAMAGVQLKRLLHPHGIFVIDFNRQRISDPVVRSVLGFMALYFISWALLSLGLAMLGLDYVTSLTGAATALGNVGPGLGDVIGPAGNFSSLPDAAKWLLSFGMLLGRLELLTIIVLLTRSFWRD